MVIRAHQKFYIGHYQNDTVVWLDKVENWTTWLSKIKQVSNSTTEDYARSLNRFWIWSLHCPMIESEEFEDYLSRYLSMMRNGFKITSITQDGDTDKIEIPILECRSKADSTINKELKGIESYFAYLNQKDANPNSTTINYRRLNISKSRSFGDGFGLSMGSISIEAFAPKEKKIRRTKRNAQLDDARAFPFELYDELLLMSHPRERLIYLLCGACSARVGQALNFTLYDIDYASKDVWLIDPTSNDQLGKHSIPRYRWLMEEYNLDSKNQKPHSLIRFKYPIPLSPSRRRPLYWIDESYRILFFQTLNDYHPMPEYLRKPRHPFAFVTKQGNRLSYQSIVISFTTNIKMLQKKYPAYHLSGLGLHSLRHMYGTYMAELYNLAQEGIIKYPPEKIRKYCQIGMGHNLASSTNEYFNGKFLSELKLGREKLANYIKNRKILIEGGFDEI